LQGRSFLHYGRVWKNNFVIDTHTTFDFEFEDDLTQQEIDNLIYIIEGWSEYEGGAFLEIPGGIKDVDIGYEFIKQIK
jgi:hypothetical protein